MLNRICLGALLALLAAASWAATVGDFPKAKIAVVGGTFINDALLKKPGLIKGSFTIKTKVGESPKIETCPSRVGHSTAAFEDRQRLLQLSSVGFLLPEGAPGMCLE